MAMGPDGTGAAIKKSGQFLRLFVDCFDKPRVPPFKPA